MSDAEDPGPGMSIPQFRERLREIDPETSAQLDETILRAGPVGNQLFAARTLAQLSQVALAQRSGVRQSDISDIENGRGNPTKRTLEKLGTALDIDFTVGKSSAA